MKSFYMRDQNFLSNINLESNPVNSQNSTDNDCDKCIKKKKAMFTKEEDKKLIEVVNEYGDKDWDLIASFLENRTKRQCRERWIKFLCPKINASPWTKEEDELLLKKYNEIGPKWTLISKSFKNRTDVNIKARFIVLNRKIKKESEFMEKIKIFSRASSRINVNQKKANTTINKNHNSFTDTLTQQKLLENKLLELIHLNANEHQVDQQIPNLNNKKKCSYIYSNNDNNQINDNDEKSNKSFFNTTFDYLKKTIKNDIWDEVDQEGTNFDSSYLFYM